VAKQAKEKFMNFYSNFYSRLSPNSSGECPVKAFCHDDVTESMSINLISGKWFCHACEMGGDTIEFYTKYKEIVDGEIIPFPDAKNTTEALENDEPIDDTIIKIEDVFINDEIVKQKHNVLLNEEPGKHYLKFLMEERGYTLNTIKKFNIIWDADRIGIPIYDNKKRIVNIRRYSKTETGAKKMVSYKTGYGRARLFPIENLGNGLPILLNEGEMDCILANQIGFNAMTITGGAGSWSNSFTEKFRSKIVWICYDVDKTGVNGAIRVANILYNIASEVKIIRLPIDDISNGDFSDYILKLNHTKEDVDKLIDKTPLFEPMNSNKDVDKDVHILTLPEAAKSKYYNKLIEMNVTVAGKDTAPYMIPKKFEMHCQCNNGKACLACPLGIEQGRVSFTIDNLDTILLELADNNTNNMEKALKQYAGIERCAKYELNILENVNVLRVLLIPELDYASEYSEYVSREAYVVGAEVKANQGYKVKGTTVPHPRDQHVTHIINEVEPTKDNVERFKMTDEMHEQLKVFQAADGKVNKKIAEIQADLSTNVTHIYGRNDVLMAADLVYHSVLAFEFQGKMEKRGWVEALIIGDTRTGKSETIQQLIDHYRAGDFISGENVSFAGLVGGVNTSGKQFMITWGKIPLNDRKLVAIDEISGMSLDQIALMSGVRSSGVAELVKIQSDRTHARTRLIWISNDREGKGLGSYSYGTDAIMELIGKNEDIARFEFVVTCAADEVPISMINCRRKDIKQVPHIYTNELCHNLVMWTWSRKPEHIIWEEDAVDTIFKYSEKMGSTYTSKIPLVEAANQRIKLARLSIAIACRLYSSEDGIHVTVKKEHVDFIFNYLNNIYAKPSLGYAELSMQYRREEQLVEKAKPKIMKALDSNRSMANILLSTSVINARILEELLNMQRDESKAWMKYFQQNGMIRMYANGNSRITQGFTKILREWIQKKGSDM
jgi:DNA primase